MTQLDTTAIQGYAGTHRPSILRNITNNLSISADVFVIRNLTATKNLWRFRANKGLRPNDTSVEDTSKSAGAFEVRSIVPKVYMKILKIIPEELRDTFFSEQLSPTAKEYPDGFKQYFWEEQSKEIADELELSVFDGVDKSSVAAFSAASTYAIGGKVAFDAGSGIEYFEATAATTAGESPLTAPAKWDNINAKVLAKGLGTIIREERTAGKLAGRVTNTGAITASNALTVIDGTMWNGIPEKVKKAKGGVTFYVSHATYNARVAALRAQKANGTYYTEAEIKELKTQIIDSDGRGTIKPCVWMGTSGMIIATVKDNLVMGCNELGDESTFGNTVPLLHGYKTILKNTLAFQIQDLSVLFTNDQ